MKILIANSKQWFVPSDKLSSEHDLILISEKVELNLEFVDALQPDLIFFPHWHWLIPRSIYEKYECIVFHPAPLPFGRGGTPIQNLILRGFRETPVCALRAVGEMDAGPIYLQENLKLDGSLEDIFHRLNIVVNSIIDELLPDLPEPIHQVGDVVVFRRVTEADNELKKFGSIEKVFDQVRMVDEPSYPCAYINYGEYKIELSKAEIKDDYLICRARFKIRKHT